MLSRLKPWPQLTRHGIPAMRVSRRSLTVTVDGHSLTLKVGDTFDPTVFPLSVRRTRLRQYYESRLLAPVIDDAYDARTARERRHSQPSFPPAPIGDEGGRDQVPPASVASTPASDINVNIAGVLPSLSIPVAESASTSGRLGPKPSTVRSVRSAHRG
jgi:hypothetical protein